MSPIQIRDDRVIMLASLCIFKYLSVKKIQEKSSTTAHMNLLTPSFCVIVANAHLDLGQN